MIDWEVIFSVLKELIKIAFILACAIIGTLFFFSGVFFLLESRFSIGTPVTLIGIVIWGLGHPITNKALREKK